MPNLSRDWPWTAAKALALASAVAVAVFLVWQLANVLLMLFGAILVAVLLKSVASLVEKVTPITGSWAVGVACLIVLGVLVGFFTLMGAQIQAQAVVLVESFPEMLSKMEDRLGVSGLRVWAENKLADVLSNEDLALSVASFSTGLMSIGAHLVIVVVSGIYLALSPQMYRRGMLELLPASRRDEAGDTLLTVGSALKLWLAGQLAAMVMVGVLTTLGLWLLDIPSALALGFLAGLLEFVPYVGPVLAAVPAVALGVAESPSTGLWVFGLYALIQQIEGNLITPLVHQRTVDLPPVVTIFAILSFSVLFGPLGLLLATPLAVVCFVLVKKLWVREVLHEEIDVPGEEEAHGNGAGN